MNESSQKFIKFIWVSVSATVSAAIFEKFPLSRLTNFNAAELGNVSGEYICELFVLFHRRENEQAAEEIHSSPSSKLSKREIV